MRPLSNTIGDLVKAIEEEDKGIDRVAFLGSGKFSKRIFIKIYLTQNIAKYI